jgi:hypothetical protein
MKLIKRGCKVDIRKHSCSMRVIDNWNALSDNIVTSKSLNGFKNAYHEVRSGVIYRH